MPRMRASLGKAKKGTIKRLIKMVYKEHKLGVWLCLIFIITMSASTICSPVFIGFITETIEAFTKGSISPSEFWREMAFYLGLMGGIYVEGIISAVICNVAMAVVTQDFLNETRKAMFRHMETLPIRYFDTHKRGDIMSVYTNDIDTIRQFISSSLPGLFQTSLTVIFLLITMIMNSIWMTLVVLFGAFLMLINTIIIGGRSAKYFMKQQRQVGIVEGNIEETMQGLKVIKVFTHEEESINEFVSSFNL